jgi:polysaccharide deacetylase family protein (PEP-CTERM system associated)
MLSEPEVFEQSNSAPRLVNAFTVDVEEHFQVSAFEKHISRDDWHRYDSRVVLNTRRILRILERHEVRATFFVLGWIARHHPRLVREIHRAGHEVGSHSYWHRLVYNLTPDQFREDLQHSKAVLEDITGQAITAYRAPSFSITRNSLWALPILAEEGIQVDSSIFPIRHDRYGIPDAPRKIHEIPTEAGTLTEFPPSVLRWGWMNLPIGGGGYFRLYPMNWTLRGLSHINSSRNDPFMFYVHPWELDPEQPRLGVGTHLSRLRHHVSLHKTEHRLHVLLRHFRFAPLSEVLGEAVPVGTP